MAVYSLATFGTHAITPGTAVIYVTLTTVPSGSQIGDAFPSNRFKVGLLRFGDATGFGVVIPIIDGPQRIDVPPWATQLGFSMDGNAVAQVTEA